MKREIYEVYAKVVDSTGAYNTLSGYPKVYDSHAYSDDCNLAKNKAYGEYHSVLGAMYNRPDRQCQIAMIINANSGIVIESNKIGDIADLPDPTYAVTVTNGTGSGDYVEGAIVSITANEPEDGMMFDRWDGADNLQFETGSIETPYSQFIMPSEVVSVTALYKTVE